MWGKLCCRHENKCRTIHSTCYLELAKRANNSVSKCRHSKFSKTRQKRRSFFEKHPLNWMRKGESSKGSGGHFAGTSYSRTKQQTTPFAGWMAAERRRHYSTRPNIKYNSRGHLSRLKIIPLPGSCPIFSCLCFLRRPRVNIGNIWADDRFAVVIKTRKFTGSVLGFNLSNSGF